MKLECCFWFGFPFGNPNPSPSFVSDDDDGIKLKCAEIVLYVAAPKCLVCI